MPLERDEGEYAYAGQLILEGVPPYSLCYNMKLPGTYLAYAGMMGVFGQTDVAIHLGAMLINLAGVALLFRIARRFLEPMGAALAAATHAILTLSPSTLGLAAHATQFVMAAALGGLLLLCQALESGRRTRFFFSGFFLGLAFLCKQPGGVFGVFGFGVLVVAAARDRARLRERGLQIAWFILGALAPVAATFFWLWRAGVWTRFWFWTFTYARIYGSQMPPVEGSGRLWDYLSVQSDRWFWLAGAAALALLFAAKFAHRWLALAFFLFSAAAVSAGFYFTRHYFVLLTPALGILIGAAGQVLSATRSWGKWVAPALFGGLCLSVPARHPIILLHSTPEQASHNLYGGNPFPECREIGRHIRENSNQAARIVVLGSEPEICFYARRRSATGYIYMYDLITEQPFAGQMQKEMMAQVEAAKPEYLVFVRDVYSWKGTPAPVRPGEAALVQWSTRLASQFEPEGLVLVRRRPQYFWGPDAFNRPPQPEPFISVLKRRP